MRPWPGASVLPDGQQFFAHGNGYLPTATAIRPQQQPSAHSNSHGPEDARVTNQMRSPLEPEP